MTVIAAMIVRSGTAHATDSFLTTRGKDGKLLILEGRATKVIGVRTFRGALAYWGFAGERHGERTADWLVARAVDSKKFATPEEFAAALAAELQVWLTARRVASDPRHGIGIHFTAYERIGDYWIPELFLISNFEDPSYSRLRAGGVGYSRETYSTITGLPRSPQDREPDRRLKVHRFLREGSWLRFNNGEPDLFNPAADATQAMLAIANKRRVLAHIDSTRLRQWTRLPVEMVAQVQRRFLRAGTATVGGRIHDLSVTPGGKYESDSGDEP